MRSIGKETPEVSKGSRSWWQTLISLDFSEEEYGDNGKSTEQVFDCYAGHLVAEKGRINPDSHAMTTTCFKELYLISLGMNLHEQTEYSDIPISKV
jgi:hypothetical protein